MPDFFERLVARSAGRPGRQPRALPRLAHPFERAGARELEPEFAEVTAARPASVTQPAPAPPPTAPVPGLVERHVETVHHERELHRTTVVERNAITATSSVHRVLERLEVPQQPLLVPVPVPGAAAAEVRPPEPAAASPAAPRPVPAAPQAVRALTAVAKQHVPVPARRVAPEPERVVHVSIGRVEVKAAAPPARKPRSGGRVAPAVELEKYLAREGS